MITVKKLKRYLKCPAEFVLFFNRYKTIRCLISDSFLLKCLYRVYVGKKLNLKNPKTFNEKLQWLKIHDRKPIYTKMVDKYEAKQYVAERIGAEYVVPNFGVWDSFDEIDFDSLPEQFVLKSTHDCGGLVICTDKSKLDKEAARQKINKSMKRNYYWSCREWPYKNVKPRILAEQFISDGEHKNLIVYKVLCFHGEPRILQVIQDDKQPNESIDYFDTEWNLLELKQNFPNSENHLPKPEFLDNMLNLSRELSKDIPFIRVDWYIAKEKILFSELTFYSDAGVAAFTPEKWDETLGSWIHI